MSNFIMNANRADTVYRYAMLVMRNLESQMDNVSRQITCAQAAAQINGGRYAFDTDGMHGGEGNEVMNMDNEEDDSMPTLKTPAYVKAVNAVSSSRKSFTDKTLDFDSLPNE